MMFSVDKVLEDIDQNLTNFDEVHEILSVLHKTAALDFLAYQCSDARNKTKKEPNDFSPKSSIGKCIDAKNPADSFGMTVFKRSNMLQFFNFSTYQIYVGTKNFQILVPN